MDRGDVSGEEGAVWYDEVVAQALSELLLALCQNDAGYLGLQFLQLMKELKELRGGVISPDNGRRGRAESPGLGASALSGRIGCDL